MNWNFSLFNIIGSKGLDQLGQINSVNYSTSTFEGDCTANVLAAISTFYICVKNPPTVVCDFNRFLIAKK